MDGSDGRRSSSGGGRRVDNQGPILLSPGGTFNMPLDGGFKLDDDVAMASRTNEKSSESDSPKPKPRSHSPDTSDSNYQLITRELFGGAISMQIPGSFQDVSTIREVPDHQEVYVDRDSDMSLIVELLSYDDAVSNDQAAAHYYNDLAQCNEAGSSSYIECSGMVSMDGFMPFLHKSSSTRTRTQYAKCGVIGRQTVTKFRKRTNSTFDEVIVLLCVVRLLDVDTDLLISLNVPLKSTKQPLAAQTMPGRSQTDGAEEPAVGRGCAALLRAAALTQSVVTQPTISEMLYSKVLRGRSVEKSEGVKAKTADFSDSSDGVAGMMMRKGDFKMMSSPIGGKDEDTGSVSGGLGTPDRGALGVSVEGLGLSDSASACPSSHDSRGKRLPQSPTRLCSLEVMRAALQSIEIHNWSLFA